MSITPATCFNRTSWQCSTAEKSGTGSFDQSHWEMNSWPITEGHTPRYWGFTRTSDSARRSAKRMKMKIAKNLQTPLIPKAVRELLTGYHATRRPAAGEQIGRWQNSAQSIVSILCRVITHVNQRLYKTQTEKLTGAARVDHSARVMPEKSKWFRPSYPPSQTPLKTPRLSREFETPEKGKYREE